MKIQKWKYHPIGVTIITGMGLLLGMIGIVMCFYGLNVLWKEGLNRDWWAWLFWGFGKGHYGLVTFFTYRKNIFSNISESELLDSDQVENKEKRYMISPEGVANGTGILTLALGFILAFTGAMGTVFNWSMHGHFSLYQHYEGILITIYGLILMIFVLVSINGSIPFLGFLKNKN